MGDAETVAQASETAPGNNCSVRHPSQTRPAGCSLDPSAVNHLP